MGEEQNYLILLQNLVKIEFFMKRICLIMIALALTFSALAEMPVEKDRIAPTETAPGNEEVKGKKDNPVKVSAKKKTIKLKKLMKAKQTVKPLKIKNARGAVKVVKVKKGTTAKIYKKISVKAKNGAITFKKGKYKKGTYKIKIKATAKGNANYKSGSKSAQVTVKVK